MFDRFSQKLSDIFSSLRKTGFLTQEHVEKALREIRIALIEADVALPTVKDFIERIRLAAVGQAVIKSVNPVQQVVKIVHDQLVQILGEPCELSFNVAAPRFIMLVGLQGSGKTTTAAKLGVFIERQYNQKVLLVSVDIYRPAAQEQLQILAEQTGVAFLPAVPGESPLATVDRAFSNAKSAGIDTIILDTAGRLHLDIAMMKEAQELQQRAAPVETLLVCDAMTGQDAVKIATSFGQNLELTGVILTRIDGDGRGGAALSMRHITQRPIKFLGVGEKMDQLEVFSPHRLAGRILDMGDIVSFVEKATTIAQQEVVQKLAKKLEKGHFNLDDMANQLEQMVKLGGVTGVMNFLPGMGKMKDQLAQVAGGDKFLKRQIAIIRSMTTEERKKVQLLNASRKRRIAAGAGVDVPQVNKLIKQYQQMQTVMKKMTSSPKSFLRGGLANLFRT